VNPATDARVMTRRRIRTAIQTEFEAGELRGRGTIRNVAEGGLFVGTTQVPHQGNLVSLSFRDNKGRGLGVSGLVWWTTADEPGTHRAPGFGIRLLDDSDDYRRFLESLSGSPH
jgi:Tfp pilus assembly protein PilZ